MNNNVSYNPIADIGLGGNNIVKYANIKNNDSVLDIGCGAGDEAFAIRRIVGEKGRVIGVDYSIDNIAICRQNCGNFGYNNVTFFVKDIEKLPFEDASFDVVVCSYMLNLFSNRENILNEIKRILKPEGHIVISDIIVNNPVTINKFNEIICKKYNKIIQTDTHNFASIQTEKQYFDFLTNMKFINIDFKYEHIIDIENGELLLYIDYENFDEWNELNIELHKVIVYVGARQK